jgi:hypothetical protein
MSDGHRIAFWTARIGGMGSPENNFDQQQNKNSRKKAQKPQKQGSF